MRSSVEGMLFQGLDVEDDGLDLRVGKHAGEAGHGEFRLHERGMLLGVGFEDGFAQVGRIDRRGPLLDFTKEACFLALGSRMDSRR